jgi:hypothetical protein
MKFSWEQTDQSLANNTTAINWKLELITTTGALYRYNRAWKVSIDGTEFSGKVDVSLDEYDSQVCAAGTHVINHNDDGTKTFAYSFTHDFSLTLNSGKYMGTYSGSGSDTLTTIPRKSTLTATSGNLGETQTLTVTRQASAFTHSIKWSCGDASGDVCTKSSQTSIPWVAPIDFAVHAPQSESVVVTFTIETFNGSTSIGTNTASATYKIPSSIFPPLAFAVTDLTSSYNTYGAFVQGQSRLKITIDTYGVYGSWIKSYKTEVDGKTYTTENVETELLSGSGELTVKVTVTDSRNRSAVSETKISVLAYKYPQIVSSRVYRSNEDGSANQSGAYLSVKFSSKVYGLNGKNGAWYKVRYKPTGGAYTEESMDAFTGNYEVKNGVYTFAADDSSYDILLLVGDRIKTVQTLLSGESLEHTISFLKKHGKVVGMAIGKLAEEEGTLDIAWQLKLNGGGDCVVEQGESGGWAYRKWNSGAAECWKIVTLVTTATHQWGTLWRGNVYTGRQNYPFPFVTKPVESVSLQSGNLGAMVIPGDSGNGVNGAYASGSYTVCRPASTAESEYYISFYVCGKWK